MEFEAERIRWEKRGFIGAAAIIFDQSLDRITMGKIGVLCVCVCACGVLGR